MRIVRCNPGINKRRQALDEKLNKSTDKTEFDPGFTELEKVSLDGEKGRQQKGFSVTFVRIHVW
jgi:hypothetical protein